MIRNTYTAAPSFACFRLGATGRGFMLRSFSSEIHRSGYPVLLRVAFRVASAAGVFFPCASAVRSYPKQVRP